MNKKDILKGVAISIITLVVGYVAMIVPFNLFLSVSKDGQRIFFIIELCIYLVIGSIFLLVQESKAKKEKARHEERARKIKDVQQNWYDVAA